MATSDRFNFKFDDADLDILDSFIEDADGHEMAIDCCGIEPFVRPGPTAGDESLAPQPVRPFPEDVATGKRLSGGTAGQGC